MTAPTLEATTSYAALDAQVRAMQAQNAQRIAQAILAYWLSRVSADDVAGTSGEWLDFAVNQILRGYDQSYLIAAAYANAVRRIEIPGARPITIPRPPPPPVEKLRRSLVFTGPGKLAVDLAKVPDQVELKPGAPQQEVDRAQRTGEQIRQMREEVRRTAGAAAAASAYKNVQNGGRDTTDLLVVRKTAVGYVRITKDKPCSFCLMLASRGPVYSEDSFRESDARFTGPGNHKVHDDCGCMLRPAFTKNSEQWPEGARRADELWVQMLRANPGIGGDDARREYRRLAKAAGLAAS